MLGICRVGEGVGEGFAVAARLVIFRADKGVEEGAEARDFQQRRGLEEVGEATDLLGLRGRFAGAAREWTRV